MTTHGHGHRHGHGGRAPLGTAAATVVITLLGIIAAAVAVGAALLWPSTEQIQTKLPLGDSVVSESGTVTAHEPGACGSVSAGRAFTGNPVPPETDTYQCERSIVDIESGDDSGMRTLLEIIPNPGQPSLQVGDDIRMLRQPDTTGAIQYSFEDYSRGMPLALITLVFAAVVIAVARWRGLRALVGIVVAFAVLVVFMLPALLDGKPAIPVALVGGAIILYAVLYLAHGVSLRTSSALLGTLASMFLAAVLSYAAIGLTRLTGLSEEQNTDVQAYIGTVSITGLLLAGFIIGSLGVLNDVTITQASSAFELAELDPDANRRNIFASAMRVGRDHIASTVYTLVLAYAGGALPLLLLFSVSGRSIQDVLTSDAVATEITRSAVGGIALALSVPLTTGIAVLLARPLGSAPTPVRSGGRHSR